MVDVTSDEAAYEGHVRPGGPAITRKVTLPSGGSVAITKLSVGNMDNNTYLIQRVDQEADETSAAMLIDAAAEPERIMSLISDTEVDAIVTTHRHADHWGALADVTAATQARTLAGADDAAAVEVAIDETLVHGDQIRVGDLTLEVIHTPGHTPGSVCLLLRGEGDGFDHHLFTGDTLFPGGPGNTFGNDRAFETIMESLRERVFALPDSTWVYPGHGDDTTLGAERGHLDEWQQRGW